MNKHTFIWAALGVIAFIVLSAVTAANTAITDVQQDIQDVESNAPDLGAVTLLGGGLLFALLL